MMLQTGSGRQELINIVGLAVSNQNSLFTVTTAGGAQCFAQTL